MRSTAASNGDAVASSGIRSPNSAASPSSPTGLSSETSCWAARMITSASTGSTPASSAISSIVASRSPFGLELALGAVELLQHVVDVDRDPDRARLVGDRARDRLADPPGGVGGELEALAVVELLDRAHQADRALLDQIEERQALVAVALGDRDHEPQVRRVMWSFASRSPRSIRLASGISSSAVSSGVLAIPSRNCWRESRVGSGAVRAKGLRGSRGQATAAS